MLSCAPGPPTSLSTLVRARLCCSLKGIVHTVVVNRQFLFNFLHGIARISQNKNRLSSLRRKLSFSGHFESIIKPTNADAPDTHTGVMVAGNGLLYTYVDIPLKISRLQLE